MEKEVIIMPCLDMRDGRVVKGINFEVSKGEAVLPPANSRQSERMKEMSVSVFGGRKRIFSSAQSSESISRSLLPARLPGRRRV